jgi:hypothetical protein
MPSLSQNRLLFHDENENIVFVKLSFAAKYTVEWVRVQDNCLYASPAA